ncbi:MAG: hypothetical protein QXZ06_03095 [Candidatus Jordarchaeales archaeon]
MNNIPRILVILAIVNSPQTQKIMISRQAKFKEKMKNAARLAGINFK